jgi:hypothetical protein
MAAATVMLMVEIVRWVGDQPFPGLVEARLVDAHGRNWEFIDKHPMFDAQGQLSSAATYPVRLVVPFSVVEDRGETLVVSSATPAGIETTDGMSRFEVRRDQIVQEAR